jgi:xanthine dehydrogenase YagS FAD-binding subunit
MAGGTDLIGALKDDILPAYPDTVVNLKTIRGLDQIRRTRQGLAVGALVTLAQLEACPDVRAGYPALAQAAHAVATPQIRNVGTLGGNLCQEVRCWYYRYPRHVGGPIQCARKGSGPCLAIKGDNRYHAILGGKKCFASCPSDTAVALTALDAAASVAGPNGKRRVPVQDLWTPMGTVLGPGELVDQVFLPNPPPGARQHFLKFATRSAVDFAIVSVAVLVVRDGEVCKEARIALGAVAPTPVRATAAEESLVGKRIDEASAQAAADAALAGARPLSGNAYKVEIAKTLVRRALLAVVSGA